MKGRHSKAWVLGLAGAAMLAATTAQANDDDSFLQKYFNGISIGGFFQLEAGVRLTNKENPFNVGGNPFNGRPTPRSGQFPALTRAGVPGLNDVKSKEIPRVNNDFNLQLVRSEIRVEWPITNHIRLKWTTRAVATLDRFDNIDDPQGDGTPPINPVGLLNDPGGPNFFQDRYDSCTPNPNAPIATGGGVPAGFVDMQAANGRADYTGRDLSNARTVSCLQKENGTSPLEFAGQDYLIDFPNLYLDINYGPALVRIGNQTIAWGNAIFFRVLDVPNALDLRRHSLLDFVSEEFSDKRVPALGIRASINGPSPFFFLDDHQWNYDAFIQRFRPTIFGNANTPYNVIAAEFTVHNHFKDVDDKFNYGIRVKGTLGPVDLQFIAARVYNPNGVFHWTKGGVEEGLPGTLPNITGAPGGDTAAADVLNTIGGLIGNPTLGTDVLAGTLGALSGSILANTPFEVDPTGVTSGAEFSFGGGIQRLDHFNGLNELIQNYPQAQLLGAMRALSNNEQLRQEDLFLQLTDGLRGHVARDYFRENNFGFGVTHNFTSTPGSFLDQLIVSIEAKYTPNRVFTPIDLSPQRKEFIESSETEVAVVFNKYQRFTSAFPSTFMILQYLYRSDSDIFGRNLKGYGGGTNRFPCTPLFPDDIGCSDPLAGHEPPSSFNAIAFAFQQPFPNRIFTVDFATLLDVQGGLLVQPSITWKPNRAFKLQGFVNYIETIYGHDNNNALDTVDFADELTIRATYQF